MGYETDLKLFIDGVWKSGEGRDAHTVINPVTGGGIAEGPYATEADLEDAPARGEGGSRVPRVQCVPERKEFAFESRAPRATPIAPATPMAGASAETGGTLSG